MRSIGCPDNAGLAEPGVEGLGLAERGVEGREAVGPDRDAVAPVREGGLNDPVPGRAPPEDFGRAFEAALFLAVCAATAPTMSSKALRTHAAAKGNQSSSEACQRSP